jgi:hypothetical protein
MQLFKIGAYLGISKTVADLLYTDIGLLFEFYNFKFFLVFKTSVLLIFF